MPNVYSKEWKPLPSKRRNDVICSVVNTGSYPLFTWFIVTLVRTLTSNKSKTDAFPFSHFRYWIATTFCLLSSLGLILQASGTPDSLSMEQILQVTIVRHLQNDRSSSESESKSQIARRRLCHNACQQDNEKLDPWTISFPPDSSATFLL